MAKKRSIKHKADNLIVTVNFLRERTNYAINAGYTKQKWIEFCEYFLKQGYTITLYEARQTVSKYVSVSDGAKSFKVRFSNHAPILVRELRGDCDFFVGRSNLKVTTTQDAIEATENFFQSMHLYQDLNAVLKHASYL